MWRKGDNGDREVNGGFFHGWWVLGVAGFRGVESDGIFLLSAARTSLATGFTLNVFHEQPVTCPSVNQRPVT